MKCDCRFHFVRSLKTAEETSTAKERSFFDNASNMVTNLLSGGNTGNMPVAEGAVSDLFDRPLFFALYNWFIQVRLLRPWCRLKFIFKFQPKVFALI